MANRTGCRFAGAGRVSAHVHSAETTTPAVNMAPAAAISRRRGTAGRVAAGSSGTPPSRSSSCTRASPIAWSRRFGSFSRHDRRSRRRLGGTPAGSKRQFGSVLRTDANVSEIVSPVNRRWPASISKTTTPNAQISARLSAGRPLACSGLMYAALPRMRCAAVAAAPAAGDLIASTSVPLVGSRAFASPKSSTFTVPSSRILMFAGFRSR
jgi:hypothetical protein